MLSQPPKKKIDESAFDFIKIWEIKKIYASKLKYLFFIMNSYDYLHLANEKSVTKTFENGESILLSTSIYKFNDEGKR